jgi:tetratricopeptide (TPR) repeat protein
VTTSDTRFGAYVLLHELGRGGQAVVWLAEDTRLKRRVALKILPALGPGSERVLARFRREAEVTSKLEHPVICPVYEAEVHGGVPFLAMRFVDGETLARRITLARAAGAGTVTLRGEPGAQQDWNTIATFFAKIARALHTAHEAGVVHRDIKPANVMVTPEGEPVVLDFGFARQDDPDSQALSLSGEHSGTPTYMSPEQITGRVRPDRRSDVYSLGCTLYEVLTGRPPFEAPTLEGLLHAVLHDDADDASRKNHAVPEDLAVITATATRKERDRRYKTALDLALDLERFVALQPIAARPLTATQRVARWAARNPALAGALGAVLVLFLAATGAAAYAIGATGRADAEAQLRRQSDEARERMLQAAADRDLAGRIDELSLKFGTLMFSPREVGADTGVASLLPAFTALVHETGIDLAQADAVAAARTKITALRARDADLADALIDLLHSLSAMPGLDAAMQTNLATLLAGYEDDQSKVIAAARAKWAHERIDTFGPLLEEQALQQLDVDHLAELASALAAVPERSVHWQAVLDRAILTKPDSYKLQFMRGGITFNLAASNMQAPDERLLRIAIAHLQAAIALRPRSGLARASMAGAQAVLAMATGERSGFVTAWQTMESATRVDPDNAVVWYFRADFLRRSPGRGAQAIEACKKALELDPSFTPAATLLEQLSH